MLIVQRLMPYQAFEAVKNVRFHKMSVLKLSYRLLHNRNVAERNQIHLNRCKSKEAFSGGDRQEFLFFDILDYSYFGQRFSDVGDLNE